MMARLKRCLKRGGRLNYGRNLQNQTAIEHAMSLRTQVLDLTEIRW